MKVACEFCQTEYEVPAGRVVRVLKTRELPKPAHVGVYAVLPGTRTPDWENDPVIHRCHDGVPGPVE